MKFQLGAWPAVHVKEKQLCFSYLGQCIGEEYWTFILMFRCRGLHCLLQGERLVSFILIFACWTFSFQVSITCYSVSLHQFCKLRSLMPFINLSFNEFSCPAVSSQALYRVLWLRWKHLTKASPYFRSVIINPFFLFSFLCLKPAIRHPCKGKKVLISKKRAPKLNLSFCGPLCHLYFFFFGLCQYRFFLMN